MVHLYYNKYMCRYKKLLAAVVAAALLLQGCGAGGSAVAEMDGSLPLVTVDGEAVVTVQELRNKTIEYQTERIAAPDEKEIFKEMAQYGILSRIAEDYGLTENRNDVAEAYDSHMKEIADTDTYPGALEEAEALRDALSMSEEEFRTWNIAQNGISLDVENLLDDIGDTYTQITDPTLMDETVMEEIYAIAALYDIQISYPGLEDWDVTFDAVSTEGRMNTKETETAA